MHALVKALVPSWPATQECATVAILLVTSGHIHKQDMQCQSWTNSSIDKKTHLLHGCQIRDPGTLLGVQQYQGWICRATGIHAITVTPSAEIKKREGAVRRAFDLKGLRQRRWLSNLMKTLILKKAMARRIQLGPCKWWP
jgi:hypothetical protein